jgi:DNA-binding NtrC family response regulator
MSSTVILAVGLDSLLLESHVSAWQSAGYIVTLVGSVRDAIARFRDGDFDIVILSQSIPVESRERLTFLIRASGSRVPIACITNSSSDCESLSDATIKVELTKIVKEMGELMASPARMPASRNATSHRAPWQATVQ